MKKILHVIPSLGLGGCEKVLVTLCKELPEFNHSVVALKSGGHNAQILQDLKIPVKLLHSPDGFFAGILDMPRLFWMLRRTIKQQQIDIVHSWLSRANVISRLANWGLPATEISSLRVMETEKNYHLWMERVTRSLCKCVTVNSSSLFAFAQKHIGLKKEKLILIPNAIKMPVQTDPETIKNWRALWGANDMLYVGTIGRLHQQKGHDIFLQAAKIVSTQMPNVKFVIIGDGPQRDDLQKQIQTLHLQKQVVLCGWVDQPLNALAALDVFAFCSRWEGMPNSVLEAMALAKPIACSAFSGAQDLLTHKQDSLIFPIEDPAAAAQAILQLLRNPELAQSYGQTAFKRAQTTFSLSQMLDQYRKLYESL